MRSENSYPISTRELADKKMALAPKNIGHCLTFGY